MLVFFYTSANRKFFYRIYTVTYKLLKLLSEDLRFFHLTHSYADIFRCYLGTGDEPFRDRVLASEYLVCEYLRFFD